MSYYNAILPEGMIILTKSFRKHSTRIFPHIFSFYFVTSSIVCNKGTFEFRFFEKIITVYQH